MQRVIVIGAGAAGSMAAIFAASVGARTLLLERTRDGGRKILISGGGRCNVLPMTVDESWFVTDSPPHLLRRMVRAWPLAEQRAFFEETLRIPLIEEAESGKLFPASHRARDVRDGLLSHARKQGVQVRYQAHVSGIRSGVSAWEVSLDNGETIEADAVVVATGGLSVPTTGSDGEGLAFLAGLGHTIHPTYPALTPITADPNPFHALAGVSLTVSLTARSERRSARATGGFLFTHRGYSGPALLDVSHVLVRARAERARAQLLAQWTPLSEEDWVSALEPRGSRTVLAALRAELPNRLAAVLLSLAGVEDTRQLAALRRPERRRLLELLVRCELPWSGDEGYRKAEVTGGGVALDEVHARTMESRLQPGLFLCGEVLDAFGPIGGYNFLWAWVTGRAAGLGAAAAVPH